jgi:hypothetical protein
MSCESRSHIRAWLAYEAGEEKSIVYNDADQFRILMIETAFAEAEATITPELCALRDCNGSCVLELAISGCAPLSTIQRIIGIAPELAREKSCFGYTMLQEVFRIGHVERDTIVPLLLAAYPEIVSVKGFCSEIPIYTMIRLFPELETFRVLHAAAEAIGFDDLSARDINGDTILHLAVTKSAAIAVAIVGIRRETKDAVNLRGLRPFHSFCFSEAEFSENDALLIFHSVYNQWVPLKEKMGHLDLYNCDFIQQALNNCWLHTSIKQWLVEEHPAWCECASPSFEQQLEDQRVMRVLGGGRL